ncbi:MAG: NRAMP family divalent metal transporter [Solirubrobacteraceae bacterium]|jgi:Mn2+/Fe2+ NRAMP family transporter
MSVPAPPFTPSADRRNALDRAHIGDIEGALGTVRAFDSGPRLTARRKLATLLAVLGPGVVVMVADNDAGTISVFAQTGQDHGMRLLWVLAALCPALYVTQEMVARLGAVTGAGHARLTLERFGRLWCGFSLADLLALNLATLVTELIGVALALRYLGVATGVSVPIAAAVLIAVTCNGSFRRWERAMYAMVAGDLALIPLAVLCHPRPGHLASGLIPSLGGGSPASTLLLLLVALVGTTLAPAQLFFQQSSVVDKRITPRWLDYERADTAIGAALFAACAAGVMILSAAALGAGAAHGHFHDAAAVARGIGGHFGRAAGVVFAIALLNASLLGAGVVSLSGSYAIAEVVGIKHSLHRSWRDARAFHSSFAAIVVLAAAIVLLPRLPLGAVTTLVQAFAGILLPSTLVLLLILCNDTELLGPLTNGRWLNATAIAAVGVVLALSTLLTITTVLPHLAIGVALLATAALLTGGGLALATSYLRDPRPTGPPRTLTPWQRRTWSTPSLELVAHPEPRRPRVLALALLRVYILAIAGLLLLKLVGAVP